MRYRISLYVETDEEWMQDEQRSAMAELAHALKELRPQHPGGRLVHMTVEALPPEGSGDG